VEHKKLFAENNHLLTGTSPPEFGEKMKVEPVFENEAFYGGNSRARGWSRRGRSLGRGLAGYRNDTAPAPRNTSSSTRNNPLNADGSISVCAICSSKMHWAKLCPHAYERQSSSVLYGDEHDQSYFGEQSDEEVQVTLLTAGEETDSKMDCLLGETIGKVLLDSGCSKTV
jgi:hypothetical protein